MNTDHNPMYEWQTLPWRTIERSVFKLQKRIYQASQKNDSVLVHQLQRLLISSWSAKGLAVRRVTQDNQGKNTAGIDGMKALSPKLRMHLVQLLRVDLKTRPVRRVWIPKPNAPTEKRGLGIPTLFNRGTQALAKMALEPEWEAKFEPNSFGFRPGRSCQDAIRQIYNVINLQPRYVLDADIASCFDKIDQAALLEKMATSPFFARPIRQWLKAGVVDQETFMPTQEGTPQGGVLSPLLANMALHGLEDVVKKAGGPVYGRKNGIRIYQNTLCIRYADDFVVFHNTWEGIQRCKETI